MTDTRKLLERCAKVMGGLLYVEDCDGWIHVDAEGMWGDGYAAWNPLQSVADAAELAIKCKVDVLWVEDIKGHTYAVKCGTWDYSDTQFFKDHPTEQAAYCWAIVNVVAQMAEEE